jgi:hypothetical protein
LSDVFILNVSQVKPSHHESHCNLHAFTLNPCIRVAPVLASWENTDDDDPRHGKTVINLCAAVYMFISIPFISCDIRIWQAFETESKWLPMLLLNLLFLMTMDWATWH